MDVADLFKNKFNQMRKEDQARYFLMKVEKVQISEKNPDAFRVIGTRLDNETVVAVVSKKSSSGQLLPQAGGILRADKVKRTGTLANRADVSVFNAEYFHAYQQDELCLKAVIQPSRPVLNDSSGMWGAQVHAFDLESNVQRITGDRIVADLEQSLLKALTPWTAQTPSPITHDVKGTPVWGDGATAKRGLSPFALVRFAGQSFKVYGASAVKQDDNAKTSFRLPTETEIMQRIKSNPHLQNLKAVAAGIDPGELSKLSIYLIPGLSVQVGRDSLNGAEQKYLRVPEAFDWVNRERLDAEGKPTIQPGFRLAEIHVKQSRQGNMMVVDAVPSVGGKLTRTVPDTALERADALAAAQGAATDNTQHEQAQPTAREAVSQPAAAQPAQTKQNASPRQPEIANEVPNDFDDPDMSADDFLQYADDLAAMELMNNSTPVFTDEPDNVDDLLSEAAQRHAQRRSRPSM